MPWIFQRSFLVSGIFPPKSSTICLMAFKNHWVACIENPLILSFLPICFLQYFPKLQWKIFMINNRKYGLNNSWGIEQHKKLTENTDHHPFLCCPSRSIKGASHVFWWFGQGNDIDKKWDLSNLWPYLEPQEAHCANVPWDHQKHKSSLYVWPGILSFP